MGEEKGRNQSVIAFISKLEDYYECTYPKEVINAINEWVEEKGIKEIHLDKIYKRTIKEFKPLSYKKKPGLNDLDELNVATSVDKSNVNGAVNALHSSISKMSTQHIYKVLKGIRKKEDDAKTLSTLDIETLHEWEILRVECDVMVEEGMSKEEIAKHLEYVKDSIVIGNNFVSIFERVGARKVPVKEVKRGMHEIKDVI